MDRLPQGNFVAWRDHIQKLIHSQVGLDGLNNSKSISLRDALTIDRLNIVAEIDYWNRRQKESDEATLEIHEMIADYFKKAALIAIKSPSAEAAEIFNDLAFFGKQLASRATPKAYGDKVFVGNALISFLNENRWPRRSELSSFLKTGRRPITRTSMDVCLDFFGVRDFVRDNQKG